MRHLKEERLLVIAFIAMILAVMFERSILAAGQAASLLASVFLIGAIVLASLRVAHHAEVLAENVGEPYGTMILTISAVVVEVVILVIMTRFTSSSTLVRDTIYSAVMLDMNGILGIAAVLGGLRHGEQPYNVDSGNTYIVLILTAIGVSMIIPAFLPPASHTAFAIFTIAIMSLLYGMFIRLQTTQHSYFFSYRYADTGSTESGDGGNAKLSIGVLIAGIVLIGVLAEVMAKTVDEGLSGTGVPPIVAAVLVAFISASPELLTAVRAALADRMQPVVNIALGASLPTVILTVPIMQALALFDGAPLAISLTSIQTVMVLLTLAVAAINLHDGETNAIEGMTHFVLFAAFLMLAGLGL